MKAKLIEANERGNIAQNRKENHFMEEYAALVIDKKANHRGTKIRSVASLRIYGTQAKNYCCLWVNDSKHNIYTSGGGNAGGYGYHRPSQAAGDAIEDAGFELSEPIGGRGDQAIEDALEAIVKALGYRNVAIHKAHA